MGIEIIDLLDTAKRERRRMVVMNTRKFHAWIHYFPSPGDRDRMHCHNADQTFYCIDGECTLHFPDGGKAVLVPGKAALIPGGSFYQLENTGQGPMVLMGNRSGSRHENMIIDYETGKDLRGFTPAKRFRRAVKRAIFGKSKKKRSSS